VGIESADEEVIRPYVEWSTVDPIIGAFQPSRRDASGYAEDSALIEEFSVSCAVRTLGDWFPGAQISVQNHNNPGFDIVVARHGQVLRFIEVKGTRSAKPIFHLTENERRFSAENANLYMLLVFWGINLADGSYQLARHEGEVAVGAALSPVRYIGCLSP
jgi:hypothetical protein